MIFLTGGKTEMTQSKIDEDLNSNRPKGINITEFWKYVLEQNAEKIRAFFAGMLMSIGIVPMNILR